MNPSHVNPEKSKPNSMLDEKSEGLQGASMSPPAFQLLASDEGAPPSQKQNPAGKDQQQAPGADQAPKANTEINAGSDFPWDCLVLGGPEPLQKNANSDPKEVIATIPQGKIVQVWIAQGAYYFVFFGSEGGWVRKASLKQLSFRLSRHEQLMEVMRGNLTLKAGDSGAGVTVVQQLLAEIERVEVTRMLGSQVTGTIDAKTEELLKAVQGDMGIAETGCIDQATISGLNDHLLGKAYALEALQLATHSALPKAKKGEEYEVGKAPKDLLKGTHNISLSDQAAFESAISTEVKGVGGVPPTFTENIGGKSYGKRIEAYLDANILDLYNSMAKGKEALHQHSKNLHSWKQIEKVAKHSTDAVDDQFNKYRRGKTFKATGINPKLKDAWTDKKKQLNADPSIAKYWASWRVQKMLDGDGVIAAIDDEHGAVQDRAPEAAIIKPIKAAMMKKYHKELVEIHKAWPAFAGDNGNVFLQRFKEKDPLTGKDDMVKGRDYMWEQFQTIIHEYIHTLEHSQHVKYRDNIDDSKGGFTLREGIPDYFTKIAYNNTDRSDKDLRKDVEGPFHDPLVTHALPEMGTYDQSQNAEAAAGVIGFPNMCAAFFLGQTELYKHV